MAIDLDPFESNARQFNWLGRRSKTAIADASGMTYLRIAIPRARIESRFKLGLPLLGPQRAICDLEKIAADPQPVWQLPLLRLRRIRTFR